MTGTEPSDRAPVSCRDGDDEMFYSETEPGGATREELSKCLHSAAERGEVIALTGQLVASGALIEVGDASVFWSFTDEREEHMTISVFDDRVWFQDRCEGRLELLSGVLTEIASGYCNSGAVELSTMTAKRTDFTIFIIGQQFVAVGEDGWYHINFHFPRVELTSRNSGIWITAIEDWPGPRGGAIFFLRRPLAGNGVELQDYYAVDWIDWIMGRLIPHSFREAAREFFPDALGYWRVMKNWVDAIMDDLFHRRIDRPELDLVATEDGLMYSDESAYLETYGDTFGILNQVARVVAGTTEGYGPALTATLLMMWERYVPDFDHALARQLADRFSVQVGVPVEVNAISDRTTAAHQALSVPAPEAPSDFEPIDPEELHLSIVLEVGREEYIHVVSSDIEPGCGAQYDSDGSFSGWYMYPFGEFTVNAGGFWNGLRLVSFSDVRTGEGGMSVTGTPTAAGRVRVRVLTHCYVEEDEEPTLLGYSEIIVVDPSAGE